MAHTYTAVYACIATNGTPSALSTALAAIPRDTDTETLLGLSLVSDTVGSTGGTPKVVSRTIVLTDAGMPADAPLPSGQPIADFLDQYYTGTFWQKLSAEFTSTGVVIT
jgi:hypothetical protein